MLANRPAGHSVDVMGLLGNGFSMKPEGRYLLVGGGIGVPPWWAVPNIRREDPPHRGLPLPGEGHSH